jgi:hypothetical protein
MNIALAGLAPAFVINNKAIPRLVKTTNLVPTL